MSKKTKNAPAAVVDLKQIAAELLKLQRRLDPAIEMVGLVGRDDVGLEHAHAICTLSFDVLDRCYDRLGEIAEKLKVAGGAA